MFPLLAASEYKKKAISVSGLANIDDSECMCIKITIVLQTVRMEYSVRALLLDIPLPNVGA